MADNSSYFLFAGLDRPVTSHDLSSALHWFSVEKFNIPLRLGLFRQYMAFITACNTPLFACINAPAGTTSAQEQFGHTGEMDRMHYGGDERIPVGLDRYMFMAMVSVSGVFHMLFGHEPCVLRSLESGNHLRAQHLATIQNMRQPIPMLFSRTHPAPYVTAASVDAAAHAVADKLLPPMVQHVNRSLANAHAAVVDLFCPMKINNEVLLQVARHCTHPALLEKLRVFMGGKSGFKNPEQALATQVMFEGRQHLLYISPTGSGKMLLGLLNGALLDNNRAMLWILPLLSMHFHYGQQSTRFGISHETWTPKSNPTIPKLIVLVTIELTQLEQFKEYMLKVHANGRLARIIVDEVHLVLTHAGFRKVMESLTWLGPAGPQIVLQTATLPPGLQDRLLKALGLTSCFVIRAKTCRPNLASHIVHCTTQTLDSVIKDYFYHALAHSEDGRIMIFCRSKSKAEQVADLLQIPYCHSALPKEEQDEILRRLHNGAVRAVAATSLLGVAVDIPNVTHTIHVDAPYDIISYVQEAGRAGRDSDTMAWSFIIFPQDGSASIDSKEDLFGRDAMRAIIRDNRICRRLAIHVYLDGVAEPCSMLQGVTHLCDVCCSRVSQNMSRDESSAFPWTHVADLLKNLPVPVLPTPPKTSDFYCATLPPPTPMQLQVATTHAARHIPALPPPHPDMQKLARVHNTLLRLAQKCVVCWLQGCEAQDDHLLANCTRAEAPNDRNARWLAWKARQMEYCKKMQGICYACACPQDISEFLLVLQMLIGQ